jgi:hypothetical protein
MRVLPSGRQAVHQTTFRHPLNPPSVTSVTSVRCFPPMRVFLAQKPICPPENLPPSNLNPPNSPSVASVTSVRCFSFIRASATEWNSEAPKWSVQGLYPKAFGISHNL